MSEITTNRPRQSRFSMGGVRKIYVLKYVDYGPSQIDYTGNILNSFPTSTIYELDFEGLTIDQTPRREGGTVVYTINGTMEMHQTKPFDEIHDLMRRDYRLIYEDHNGSFRILGLFNGLEFDVVDKTGGQKTENNGYTVTFTGEEPDPAKWITDLTSTGFVVYEINNKVFQTGCNAVFQSGQNIIFN